MKILAFLIYIPLQLVWLPISLLGAIWVGYKQVWGSKRLGLSHTAIEIINGRWTLDWFGLRPDKAAGQLIRQLPNTSVIGLKLTLLPLWLTYQITRQRILYPRLPAPADAKLADMVASRSHVFDRYIEDHAPGADQFVILGGGLDTRCYGPLKDQKLNLFELDRPAMQTFKQDRLDAAGVAHEHVDFIPVDFARPDWLEALASGRYDPSARSLFLLEGVTLYLKQDAIEALFATLKQHAAPQSVVILDLYADYFIKFGQRGGTGKSLELTGEGLQFGLDFAQDAEATLLRFFKDNDLHAKAHTFLGSTNQKGPYMVIAAVVI